MFNQVGFNLLPFNQAKEEISSSSITLSAESGMTVTASAEYAGTTVLSAESGDMITGNCQYAASAALSVESGISAKGIRERISAARLSGTSGMTVNGRRMRVYEMHIDIVQPGQEITIDTEKMTAVAGGRSVLNQLSSLSLPVMPGKNIITYTDTEKERSIDLIMRYRERSY